MKVCPSPERRIVTGRRGAGKTTFCQKMAQLARAAGWNVAGLLSRPRFEGAQRAGIEVLDLRSRETRLLANLVTSGVKGLRYGQWTFDEATLEWGNGILSRAIPCDLLVVDELGPLEFDLGLGWTAAFRVLAGEACRLALAVVRPEYCADFQRCWTDSHVLDIRSPGQALKLAQLLARRYVCAGRSLSWGSS